MNCIRKKTGAPAIAIQFTGSLSAIRIHEDLGCETVYTPGADHMTVDGVKVNLGDWVVREFLAAIPVSEYNFTERYKKYENQMDMF